MFDQKAKMLVVEDAELLFKNFAGSEGKFNPKGKRNFCLVIDPDTADKLANDGWNVKHLEPREPESGDLGKYYVRVNVNMDGYRKPKIVLLQGDTRTNLSGDMVDMLDWADLEMVDVTVSGYEWEVQGHEGVSGYLKTLYAVLRLDPIEVKYLEEQELKEVYSEDEPESY